MALVDADYCFKLWTLIAMAPIVMVVSLLTACLGKGLVTNQPLNLPPPVCLPGGSMLGPMPYVVVGDEVLPLKTYLMRQYPGKTLAIDKRVFNYRLSRARRISENAFGIQAQRWRLFQRCINLSPSKC